MKHENRSKRHYSSIFFLFYVASLDSIDIRVLNEEISTAIIILLSVSKDMTAKCFTLCKINRLNFLHKCRVWIELNVPRGSDLD